jgi:hypothetical protein
MLKTIPIFGVGTESLSSIVSRQRRVNCYVEPRADGNKKSIVVRMTPGLTLYNTMPKNPIRGYKDVNGVMYCVAGNGLFRFDPLGGYIHIITFGSASSPVNPTNPVQIDYNETQLVITDGTGVYVFPFVNLLTVPSQTIAQVVTDIAELTVIKGLTGN